MKERVDSSLYAIAVAFALMLGAPESSCADAQPTSLDWNALRREAAREYKAGRYRDSQRSLNAAIASAGVKIDPCTRADLFDSLAKVERNLGDVKQEEQSLRASLKLREEARWLEHPDARNTRTLLAIALIEQDKFSEAEALVQKELSIENAQNLGAMANPRLLELIGELEYKQKNYSKARHHFEMLVSFEESKGAPREVELRRFLVRLCDIYRELGKNRELILATKKMVAIDQSNPNLDTIGRASDFYALAMVEPSIPRKIQYLEKARLLLEHEKQPDRLTVWTLSALSGAMKEQHDLVSAERYGLNAYKEALRIKPVNKELLLHTAAQLGLLYKIDNRFDQSIGFFKKAFENAESPIPALASWHYELALIYASHNKIALARSQYEQGIAILDQIGSRDQLKVWCLSGLSSCCELEKNLKRTELLRLQALKLAEELNNQPLAASCELNLAYLYHRERDYGRAEKLTRSAIEKIDRFPDGQLNEALWLLAIIYADKGDSAKAQATVKSIEASSRSWPDAIKKTSLARSKQFHSKYHL